VRTRFGAGGKPEPDQVGKDQHSTSRALLAHRLSPHGRRSCLSVGRRPGNLERGHTPVACQPVIPARGEISTQYTEDGTDISPPLTWSGLPDGTKSLALVVEDPGAPCGVFRHRAVFDTPSGSRGLGTHYSTHRPATGLHEATDDFGKPSYGGRCPPRGMPHHRHFRRLAISRMTLDLSLAAFAADVLRTAEPYVIQSANRVRQVQQLGHGDGSVELRSIATSLCSIGHDHPFVPTCALTERGAQRQSRMPAHGRRRRRSRRAASLTERARR
jgi:Raf kinase inhibitor-like YbhB/YbcL family protein